MLRLQKVTKSLKGPYKTPNISFQNIVMHISDVQHKKNCTKKEVIQKSEHCITIAAMPCTVFQLSPFTVWYNAY